MLVGRGRREMEWTGDRAQARGRCQRGSQNEPMRTGVSASSLAHAGRVAPEGRGYRRDSSRPRWVLRIAPIRAQIPRLTHRRRRQERYCGHHVRLDETENNSVFHK